MAQQRAMLFLYLNLMNYCENEIVVLGCGNILFGDDGFGPEVAEYLIKNHVIPLKTCVINAGLSVRNILFSIILSDKRPKRIIIVDAVDVERNAGEIFELDISGLPEKKIDDFSMHQLPTSNLLKELQEKCGVEVKVITAQVGNIPEEVAPGLSPALTASVPAACDRVLELMNSN